MASARTRRRWIRSKPWRPRQDAAAHVLGAERHRGLESHRTRHHRQTTRRRKKRRWPWTASSRSSASSHRSARSPSGDSRSKRAHQGRADDGHQHPGIYAAGDITTYPGKLKLIATGFSEACIAVNQIAHFLNPQPKSCRAFIQHGAVRTERRLIKNVGAQDAAPLLTAPACTTTESICASICRLGTSWPFDLDGKR